MYEKSSLIVEGKAHYVVCVCRFSAEAEVDLQASLSALGITDIFDEDKADFRHLSEWHWDHKSNIT